MRSLIAVFFAPAIFASLTVLLPPLQAGGLDGLDQAQRQIVGENRHRMPLPFTENRGQFDEAVLFRANASGATVWFTADAVYYRLSRRSGNTGITRRDQRVQDRRSKSRLDRRFRDKHSVECLTIGASFVGANPEPIVVGEGELSFKCNYFLGNDPAKWRTDVPNYGAVVYKNIYPGIDVKYHGNGQLVKYDFIASPGADLSQIRVRYEGVQSSWVNQAGELIIETEFGSITEPAPNIFQTIDGTRSALKAGFSSLGRNTFAFKLMETSSSAQPEIVNSPMNLRYSTYLGGSSLDNGWDITTDAYGDIYIHGDTWSPDFPTADPFQPTLGGAPDVFVTKLSASGDALIYSTYLGGNDGDYSWGIAVDAGGNAYVTGWTSSTDFPTFNPFQSALSGYDDAYVVKLSPTGNSLVYSTYLGGTGLDEGVGIAVDAYGSAFVTGSTDSPDFPTANPLDGTLNGSGDAFIVKLSPSGDALIYSTYLGGNDWEQQGDIAVDDDGNAYVTGETWSPDFPTADPFQSALGGACDAFVAKLSPFGDSLIYSTYLGGSVEDCGYGIAVDVLGSAYVTGETNSPDFPIFNSFQSTLGGDYWDACVARLSPSGDSLLYSTYLGGGEWDLGARIAVGTDGSAYVAGFTQSTDFPTANPFDGTLDGWEDAFVASFSPSGDALIYSTYLGGNDQDYGEAIDVDAEGNAYITGGTRSTDFPTANPLQPTFGGWEDAFVTVLPPYLIPIASFVSEPDSGFVPLAVQFTDNSFNTPTSWLWHFGDGDSSAAQNPEHVYQSAGTYYPRLIISNEHGADTLISLNPIVALDTLAVDFSAQPTKGRKPLAVSFQSLCSTIPHNVTWYFGDGDSSGELNPVHQYAQVGSYDVRFVAELFGYQDSLTKENFISVTDIRAEFATDRRCGPAPLTVAFSDSSTGTYPITSWYWDFGDGESSEEQNPTHQFLSTEVFDVTLIVLDTIAADTLTKEGYITTQDSLSADFVGLPVSGSSPLAVMFEPVLQGIATQYVWDFGDGDASSVPNPIHTYTGQGKYDVKLKVSLELDECSQVDSIEKQEYVVVNDLEAQFSGNPTAGVAPLFVEFTDESDGTPDSWFWDFGDGNTSTTQDPSHWYDTAGVYDVFLRVRNFIGADSLLKLSYIHVDTCFTDLLCDYVYSGDSRPGFDAWLWPIWTNIGAEPADQCTMRVLLPTDVTLIGVQCTTLQSGTCSPHSFVGDTIVVPLSTINPTSFYGGYLKVWVNISESVQLGDTLVWEMWLTTTTSETNYENNYCRLELEVTGSIDPNDKLAYPEGKGLVHAIEPDQRITYTIQFENKPEATAEAIYIRVVDTLDHDLDWGSLVIGASSHPDPCDFEFDPYTGEILWFCDSIMLPPNANPPEGEGYFTFSISPEPDLPPGTEIANTAWIRFDYNEWLQAPEEGPVIRTIKYASVGDVNGDGIIELGDVVYLINYLYRSGPAPDPIQAGDANYDGVVDLGDVVYLINYLFRGGPPPGC